MALQIEEFASLGKREAPVPLYPPQAIQSVVMGGTSAAFSGETDYVRLLADEDCRFTVGAAPIANGTSSKLKANVPTDIGVNPGHKIAVIAA